MTKGHKFNKQYLPYGSTPDSDLLHFIMSHDTLTNKIGLSKIGVIHAKSCVHLAWNAPGVIDAKNWVEGKKQRGSVTSAKYIYATLVKMIQTVF